MSDRMSQATMVIAATFTAEPILPSLAFINEKAALDLEVRFAPYNQIFQELLTPTSMLRQNIGGVNVVLLRVEDFIRENPTSDYVSLKLPTIVGDLRNALKQYSDALRTPTILAILAASPNVPRALIEAVESARLELLLFAEKLPGFIILKDAEVNRGSTAERYDQEADDLGHVPFTEEYYAALALAVSRKTHALRIPAQKVLALDCDETLWRGVVGEDGVDGISIPQGMTTLQQFAVEAQSKGVLVCLVSKNAEADVLEVFEKRRDMVLSLDHIVAHRINWNPKPSNLVSLARELNLGLDSFVFIDDNPVECALMRAELPQVLTLQVPVEERIGSFLSNLWSFDKLAVTDEDVRRTAMYRENAARQESEQAATDIVAFIRSLNVATVIAPPDDRHWPRLAQMTQRTNQFNFTTIRRSDAEMRALASAGSLVLRVEVTDRFGDYGVVGLVIASVVGPALVVDTFLLSCRVLGRGVEHSILRRLGEIAAERGLATVDVPFVATAKNEPARAFADSIALRFLVNEPAKQIYRIPTGDAATIEHQPGQDPEAVIEARKAEERKGGGTVNVAQSGENRSERYAQLASSLISGAAVLAAMRTQVIHSRKLVNNPAPPRTSTERELLSLWMQLLRLDNCGIDDDFFALGGTSLIAARLFAEIARRFGARLPLTTVLDAATVRLLAQCVDERSVAKGGLIELRKGGPRNFFLVHDGDGETLLYLNLARLIPNGIGVYGIEPKRLPNIPLAHATIEDMAAYYLERIREKQPSGPYMLGGMCAGGVIAYQMARDLERLGEKVNLLAILDAARPGAPKRAGRIAQARASRLRDTLAKGPPGYLLALQKLINAFAWEVTHRVQKLSVQLRYKLLGNVLREGNEWPAAVPALTIREIYDAAESNYTPRAISDTQVFLVRATQGEGVDSPYRDIYRDYALGWADCAQNVVVQDVRGGHSSMLQEQFVRSLADVSYCRRWR